MPQVLLRLGRPGARLLPPRRERHGGECRSGRRLPETPAAGAVPRLGAPRPIHHVSNFVRPRDGPVSGQQAEGDRLGARGHGCAVAYILQSTVPCSVVMRPHAASGPNCGHPALRRRDDPEPGLARGDLRGDVARLRALPGESGQDARRRRRVKSTPGRSPSTHNGTLTTADSMHFRQLKYSLLSPFARRGGGV